MGLHVLALETMLIAAEKLLSRNETEPTSPAYSALLNVTVEIRVCVSHLCGVSRGPP